MDKQSSKSGGYAGGFFQLFDWKAKSRKKLFSSKSESPGKRSEGNLPMTRLYLMDDDDTGMDYNGRSNGGFSCASSVTDDDGSGSRGPSVVARLMGLDSMPMSISSDPYVTPFSDSQSLQDSQSFHRNLSSPHNYQMMYSRNFASEMEGPMRDIV
ncbi:hypothetical protein MLD38_017968 [Melastoma candidum]|uniref:Uncharacterized protein n=1 Tax=Melastoma candidum TaxID=119954 RepID=A0ACB9QSB2_9MYRT|nr:hypothetical protein MLD38_017968 [Melastoma candidum]